ncbi:hypothetical protein H6F78_19905 [Coleofasciculus sp. FACHB-64]|uniref:hypothetical protein n=1 Tax=Cyanophyceae TaxID=3028117 RepID=UPI001682E1F5|nr:MULTISPECIES: hypothetical protein [unclassified Coleofasciculus]MBD1841255.1 hypothetical protein [Coleofasciculus sp. FACHB-501]MBD2047824.1 hypothetical protein [Coleofasciculus sp. FACHB-64]
MAKYIFSLLVFILTQSSILIAANSQAQTVIPLETNIIVDTIDSSSSEQTAEWNTSVKSDVGNTVVNSTNAEQVVVSEAGNKATDSSSPEADSKATNQRIPMSSRIFDVSSMRQ